MNLKQRFSLIFSCLFSLVLAAVMLTVYFLFANFRQDEFVDRLAEKAETTAKLLVEVDALDYNMQRLVDKNSIRRLYKEKTQVFNAAKMLIYSSNDDGDADVKWSREEIGELQQHHKIFKKTKEYDVLGLYYSFKNKDYYILISAEDNYGYRKLYYLKYLLLGAFVTGTALVWAMSFYLSKKSLKPLDDFRVRIQEIADNKLTIRLPNAKHRDEVTALAKSFNQMMDRIDNAYNRQREFTGNASHELRTPVARIAAQLENLLQSEDINETVKAPLNSIANDIFELSEIISSLVSLAEINDDKRAFQLKTVRLDEVVFDAAAEIAALHADFKLKFEIINQTSRETDLEVKGDDTLLKIVVLNLLKNAYLYSDNHCVECLIKQLDHTLQIVVTNTGAVPNVADTAMLFATFYRGSNTQNKPGSGIGLSIVNRVLQFHNATVVYNIIQNNTNQLIVTFLL